MHPGCFSPSVAAIFTAWHLKKCVTGYTLGMEWMLKEQNMMITRQCTWWLEGQLMLYVTFSFLTSG